MASLIFNDCLSIIKQLDQLNLSSLGHLLENHDLWDKDCDELVYSFILQVIYEQKLRPDGNGIGSATITKFIYRELLYHRPDLDYNFVLDLGDWAAVYNKNPYCPMDNYRGYTVREYLKFSEELHERLVKEKEDSEKRKKERRHQAHIQHLERKNKYESEYRQSILQAICNRVSVKHFQDREISEKESARLKTKIRELKRKSNLNITLYINQPDIFKKLVKNDDFSRVSNFIVISGNACNCTYEKIGYYGEQLVLLAQTLDLSTCWVKQIQLNTQNLGDNKATTINCIIAIGYGAAPCVRNFTETISRESWFNAGLNAVSFAPVLDNKQQFCFRLILNGTDKAEVAIDKNFSESQYLQMINLGIAKLHFEIGADKKNFKWHENTSCIQ